jgi:hypothetical protein
VSEPGGERQPSSFDEWLREFFRDPGLTPIVIVVAGSLTTVGASLIAWAVRGGGFPPRRGGRPLPGARVVFRPLRR